MTTDVGAILAGAGVVLSERDEQAQRAVKAFRAMQPTLTSYARMLSKRSDVRVEMAARDNGSTDGNRIFYRPPIALGDTTPHQRKLCDKRDDSLQQRCPACRRREETLVTIYHEIAHICYDSFAQTTDRERAELIAEAVKQWAGKYARIVAARIEAAPAYTKNSYIGMAHLVNQFLPIIVNALEDARVNRELFKARKGTKKMFDARATKVFTEGVEQKDPAGNIVVIPWNQYPQNMQAIIGVFCKASGYDYTDWFVKPVVEALNDEKLTDLIRKMDTIRSASGVYHLSFPVLARLRELGFCKLDTDPTDEEEQEDDQTSDDDTSTETPQPDDASESGEPEAGSDSEGSPSPDSEADEGSGEDRDDSSTDSSPGLPDSGGVPESEPDSDDLDMGEGPDDADSEGTGVGNSDDTSSSDEDQSGGSEVESDRDEGDSDSDQVDDSLGSGGGSDPAEQDQASSDPSEGGDSPSDGGDSVDDDSQDVDPSSEGSSSDSPAEADDSEPGDGAGEESESGSSSGSSDLDATDSEPSDKGSDSSEDRREADSSRPSSDSSGDEADGDVADESQAEAGTGDIEGDPVDGQDRLAEPDGSPGEPGDGTSEGRLGRSGPDDDHSQGSEGDTAGDTEDLEQPSDEAVADSDNGESAMDSAESASDSGGVEPSEPDQQDDEIIDSGADKGLGGTKVIEVDEPLPPMGDADEVEEALKAWGQHDEPPKSIEARRAEEQDEKAIDKAIIQGMYFETPSQEVYGVNEYDFDKGAGGAWDHSIFTATGYSRTALGIDGDFEPDEAIMGPALMQMRVAFADNARGKDLRNLKSGRVDAKKLGRRAPFDDPRIFTKRRIPGKKKYFVLIGIDVSGSTVGTNIVLEKRAATAQAELCSRMGIDFAVYAHSGSYDGISWGRSGNLNLDIYRIKDLHEPWDTRTKERLHLIGPDSCNLDGHTLEYYRKRLDESDATDKIIMYYTDGKMPAENHDEELEILQRELKVCAQKRYTVMGVGIRTDSPVRHGLDTVQVDSDEDISRVVKHLEKRLLLS